MKIIAVDFDGTLCASNWPDIGKPNQFVIDELIRQQSDGAKLILWTCREGEQLQAAVKWCLEHGMRFDAVNDNLEENKALYGNNSRKVFATEYWDDKSAVVYAGGEITGIVYVNNDGGMTIKKWHRATLDILYPPPCKSGDIAYVPSQHKSVWERMKAWWKSWLCE